VSGAAAKRPLVDRLQAALEGLYRLEGPVRAGDFAIGPELVDRFVGAGASGSKREALVVASDGRSADIGLYVQPSLLLGAEHFVARAERAVRHWIDEGLDAFCVALEGVSHFLYFTFCGHRLERPVSQLELELQAEVDKFLTLRLVFGLPDLVERLYGQVRFDAGLDEEETARYRTANRHAARYARWLDRQIGRGRADAAILDARALYRAPLPVKLERIARAA
jgi:hypothetical protein